MSAFIIDPRSIDYLVAWAHRKRDIGTRLVWPTWEDVPEDLQHAVRGDATYGYRLMLDRVTATDLGRILMAENVRSVRCRYDSTGADDLPGPVDQTRVWNYRFRPVPFHALNPRWVVSIGLCLRYQSCECSGYEHSLAHGVLDAIRESAIREWTEGAPRDLSDADLGTAAAPA